MATKVLDITKEHCPMTFLDNVPRNAREQGYNVISVEHVEGTTHKVTIKK